MDGRGTSDDAQSREALLKELERLTGRAFHTADDVRRFAAELKTRGGADSKQSTEWWRKAKNATLLILLVLAFAQYYTLDTVLQIVSMRELTVFVPVSAHDIRSALAVVSMLG